MPVSQTANNKAIAFKAQSGLGSAASGAGASGLYVKGGGIKLAKALIPSTTVRNDGMTTRSRHGSRSSSAVYPTELGIGSADALLEAVQRGTWVAQATLTQATGSLTSITTTTNTIVNGGGSWLTQGVRVGDKVKLAGHSTVANNGKWFRVVGVTSSTITLPAGSLTLDGTPDTTFSLIIAKTVSMASTDRYFTVEEYDQDIDVGIYGTDMKVCKLVLNIQPNANVEAEFTFMGRDATGVSGASAPNFTSPTYTTALPLVMVDGTIRIGGVDYSILTGFSLTLDRGGATVPTLSATSPDVFLSNAKLSGSFSAIRQDLTMFTAFSGETVVDFFIDCVENEADPKDFVSFYVGNATLNDVGGQIAESGAYVETVPWTAGIDTTGGDHVATMLKIATSAP